MKSLRCLIFVVLVTTLTCEHVMADSPDDRGFGRGRMLRRLRDDLFGSNKPNPATQPRKTPTLADSKGKVPTPAGKKQANPYAAAGYPNAGQPAVRNPLKSQRDPRQASPQTQRGPQSALNPNSQDFGMVIAENDNKEIVVTRVTPGGNAANSGIRPGDLVIEVGGAELTSIEEFKSIAEAMSQGDQLEFKFQSRGGKPRTIPVQFGTAPEFDAENEVLKSGEEVSRNENGLRSVLDKSSIQANYRSEIKLSDQAPRPPQARSAIGRPAVHTISDQQFQVLQKNDHWRSQNK